MLSTLFNSNLTWSKDSKGNRSSLRRARTSFELGFGTSGKLVNKDSKDVDMPVSESEKLGVTVLGCRFSQKAEHVPIKKRRFLFRTQSPPPGNPAPQPEETETIAKRLHSLGQDLPQNLQVECQRATSDGASSADLGQIVDNNANIQGMKLVKVKEQCDENEDFSGISILAAAACNNSLGYIDEGSGVDESFGHGGSPQELMNIESKFDLVNMAEISTEGTGSCISPSPGEECPAIFKTDNSSPKEMEYTKDGTLQESAAAGSLRNKDDAKVGALESSARDDRLHWDLNIVMDEWEQPLDCQHVDSSANVADGIIECNDDVKHNDANKNLEGHEFQIAPEGADYDSGKALSSGEFRRLALETQELNIEKGKLVACIDSSRNIYFQGKVLSYEIDNARNGVVGPNKDSESLHNQEKVAPNVASCASIPVEHASGHLVSDVVAENASCSWVKPIPESGQLTCASIFEENCNAVSANADSMKSLEDYTGHSQPSGTVLFSSQVEKQSVTFPDVALSNRAIFDIGNALNDNWVEAQRSSELHGDDVKSVACVGTAQRPIDDVRENGDERDSSRSYHTNSVPHTSGASLGGQPVAPVDPMVQHCEQFLVHDVAETENKYYIDGEEATVMSSGKSMPLLEQPGLDTCESYHDDVGHSYGKFAPQEPFEDGYDTDGSQGDRGIVFGIEKSPDLGYDSQYEDGELRESSVHAWQEYDGDDEETEHVDYGSDNRDTHNLGSENTGESKFPSPIRSSFRAEVNDAGFNWERDGGTRSPCLGMQNSEKVVGPVKGSGSGSVPDPESREENRQENVKGANQSADLKMKISRWDNLPVNRRGNSDMARVRDGSFRKNFTGDQKDGSDFGDKEMRLLRSRVNPRDLSRIERPASNGFFLRRDRLGIQGSSYGDDSNPRSEREFDTVKSFGRGRCSMYRDRQGGHWADYSGRNRGVKCHCSPSYYKPASFHRSGKEDVASDCSIIKEGGAGSSSQAGRQDSNPYSRGLHPSFRRSGSPPNRWETFDMHRGIRAPGDTSPDRFMTAGRGRSFQYDPRVNRGGHRGRYNGPVRDGCVQSSLNYSHPLTRRRRSFSPFERRGNRPAHRSSSRSRTRSPNAWQSPRGRNGARAAGNHGFRHRNRSPNFRSGARMPRMRSPQSRPVFLPDHETGFMSAPRNCYSLSSNSRWIGFKRHSFLDRRSPGRTGMRGERFDMLDSPRKPKPNEYYRSAHPGRFSRAHMHQGAAADRRKHGYRQRLAHHYNLEGEMRGFRYDVEDSFVEGQESLDKEDTDFHGRSKAYSRDIESQIVPMSSREESPSLHQQDRKYNTNSKSIGMRECDEDVSPKRPS
ncbi:uncharacterized protein LOC130753603 [Actinidia eriantha]|uniref:uncharacterized protein LOC130753603 n=1 Tax=Actinidia eriantha TaxID=165200 RepID=UPI0025873F98|nr:uncharacterized protein LOC130753603 [Actinidia eriantha]XP_057463766.1 uncharacterized protein LOC130753603 [Actinidia eriantha]XP_057463767.1 uncharacterized protein LOC130753603 [Actinidia eriantha]XP_057463768.1 uncharacterized protein LOC130753603 [Actinidia eriantha]XP_057463770.1 uncharacterized protein LOC130753603 [Actinidia eriantha]